MSIAKVSEAFIAWQKSIVLLKTCPNSYALQWAAMKAQANLVMVQALYLSSIRPW